MLALEQARLSVIIEVAPPAIPDAQILSDSVPGVTPGCCAVPTHLFLGILGPSPTFPPPDIPPKVQFAILPPAFHDDFFIPLAAATPQQLLLDLITAADIVQNVAQQHAMKLQFEQGKTEDVVHVRPFLLALRHDGHYVAKFGPRLSTQEECGGRG